MRSIHRMVLGRTYAFARAGSGIGILVTLLLTAVQTAGAQDSTRKWSLGADHESGMYLGMRLSDHYRLESELGVVRSHDQMQFDAGFGGATTETVTTSNYRFGVGLLRQWQSAPRVRLYAGPRIGMMSSHLEDRTEGASSGVRKSKRTDVFLAGSVGVEYFPVDLVSFGADVQLRGVSQGHVTNDNTGSGIGGFFLPSDPTLVTRGLLMLRFYF